MDIKDLKGLVEAYQSVYVEEDVEQLDEMGQKGGGRVTGSNPNVYKPAATKSGPAGGGMDGMRGSGRDRNATQTSSSPGALRVKPSTQKPAAKPATPAAAKPAATAPAAKPAAPAAAKPAAKPAATGGAKPAALGSAAKVEPAKPEPRKKDTSITDMIGRSQVRQGAPINTGNKSSDIRSMAARGTDVGGAGSSAPKPAAPANKATGSKKPGSIVSSFDMFDVVKGHLLDEGYADTEEAAIAIMANMSEEWKVSIIEASYSAKAARAGKDIGKPGKQFEKIAKEAGERYGSKERGEKVAGAVLAKIRAKHG